MLLYHDFLPARERGGGRWRGRGKSHDPNSRGNIGSLGNFKIRSCEFIKTFIYQRFQFIEYSIEFIEFINFFDTFDSPQH